MSTNVSHDEGLSVVLGTSHRNDDDYSDKDRQLLSALVGAAKSVGDLSTTSNQDLRGALQDLRHLQRTCIASGLRSEVVAIMTQWPIPEATLGWEQRRHVARVRPSTAAPNRMASVEQSTAWRCAFARARHALLTPSR